MSHQRRQQLCLGYYSLSPRGLRPGESSRLGTGTASRLYLGDYVSLSSEEDQIIAYSVGETVEVVAYIARATAENRTDALQPYMIQCNFILLAPTLFAATMYMTLERLIRHLKGERHSIIPVRWLSIAFVSADVASFLVQGIGTSVILLEKATRETGQKIIIGASFAHVLILVLFIITAAVFHVGIRHWPSGPSLNPRSTWRTTMKLLYIISAVIIIRSLFRAAEYMFGSEGYPLQHEWTFYVFDAALMLSTMGIFGCLLPATETDTVEEDGNLYLPNFHPNPWVNH